MSKSLLLDFLRRHQSGGIALAFSGGVDSTLLLALLRELQQEQPFPWLALTMHSLFQTEAELIRVKELARQWSVPLQILSLDPLRLEQVRNNLPDRCYWCKRHIFESFRECARRQGLQTLMDGTNADDLLAYRPGVRALRELQVVSPLAELGIDKKSVRALARELGLVSACKPSSPCLATRFEYGTVLTAGLIEQIQKGEESLRRFCPEGTDIRLRRHGDLARIEVPPLLLPVLAGRHAELSAALKTLGFKYVTLDLEGFRSGSMDITFSQNDHTEV